MFSYKYIMRVYCLATSNKGVCLLFRNKVFSTRLNFDGQSHLFENCVFSSQLTLNNSDAAFTNCVFKGINDVAITADNNSNIKIINSLFLNNGTQDIFLSNIVLDNSSFKGVNTIFRNSINSTAIEAQSSSLDLQDCFFYNIDGCSLYSNQCKIKINQSNFVKCGNKTMECSVIYLYSSACFFEDSIIAAAKNSSGIDLLGASSLDMLSSTISFCDFAAMKLASNSLASINMSRIYSNDKGYLNPTQIYLDSSVVELINSSISFSKIGIYAQKHSIIKSRDSKFEKLNIPYKLFEQSQFI